MSAQSEPSRPSSVSQGLNVLQSPTPPGDTPPGNGRATPADNAQPPTTPEITSDGELPAQAGRYPIEREIARGGMGVVLRATDPTFRRPLAVKVLLADWKDKPDLEKRFLEEAQITARLQHPGVPPIHDAGRLEDGRPFFAMKLVQGQTLAELLKQRPSPAHELPRFLAAFGQLCQTIAYAHARGVLHRDLKPSNVMVGAFGEVQVMDWGLAKSLREDEAPAESDSEGSAGASSSRCGAEQTRAGTVVGTPAFMAPEQARGEV